MERWGSALHYGMWSLALRGQQYLEPVLEDPECKVQVHMLPFQ